MNLIGLYTVFLKEIVRTKKVLIQAVLSPVITTVLYFIVFGSGIGQHVSTSSGIAYGAFIVPGLIAMSLIMNAFMASSSGIYFPRFIGTIVDYLSAPLSFLEITLGFSLAATVRALGIGLLIYASALLFVPVPIAHPFLAVIFSFLISLAFSFLGCIAGLWAKDFEQMSFIPTLVIMPLSFLGGVFYAPDMLPKIWQTVTILNPVFYMIDGLRYTFFDISSAPFLLSITAVGVTLAISLVLLWRIFKTGYRLRS